MSELNSRALPFGLSSVGIGAVVLGSFLPVWDEGSVGFTSIANNTLVQSDYGWLSLILCGGCVISLVRTFERPRRIYWPFLSGLLVIGTAVFNATSDDVMTLCPIGATSTSDAGCQVAEPGLGIFVTGLGGAALVVGGWFFLRLPQLSEQTTDMPLLHRECPHCKSEIRADATVCAHCRRPSEPWVLKDGVWWRRDADTDEWFRLEIDGPRREWMKYEMMKTQAGQSTLQDSQ